MGSAISNALEKRTRIDESLREARIAVYQPLWQQTSLLPKWPKVPDVTYANLLELSVWMRDWYFNRGGIYLSAKSRAAYGKLQETIQAVIAEKDKEAIQPLNQATVAAKRTETLSEKHYECLRDKCSALRTEMTKDLLSRKRALFA